MRWFAGLPGLLPGAMARHLIMEMHRITARIKATGWMGLMMMAWTITVLAVQCAHCVHVRVAAPCTCRRQLPAVKALSQGVEPRISLILI